MPTIVPTWIIDGSPAMSTSDVDPISVFYVNLVNIWVQMRQRKHTTSGSPGLLGMLGLITHTQLKHFIYVDL